MFTSERRLCFATRPGCARRIVALRHRAKSANQIVLLRPLAMPCGKRIGRDAAGRHNPTDHEIPTFIKVNVSF